MTDVALATEKKILISSSVLALALGTGLGAAPAHATLIVTPVNATLHPGDSMLFGPNGDEFLLKSFANSGTGAFDGLRITGQNTTVGTAEDYRVAVKSPGGDFLKRFHPGDIVDSSADFNGTGQDPFKDPGTRFYGLDINEPADPFGWVDLDLQNNGDLLLKEFAFQDTEGLGAPIPGAAGVPEPGTLSLFALGGAALLRARRRKKELVR